MTSHMVSPSAERHRRQQSADRRQNQKVTPRSANDSRRGVWEKFRQRPTLPHGNRAVPAALEGLTAVFGMGGWDDWRPIVHRRQQSADRKQHQKATPRARMIRGGASGENSGSDLLSHTETVQYHRLWRA